MVQRISDSSDKTFFNSNCKGLLFYTSQPFVRMLRRRRTKLLVISKKLKYIVCVGIEKLYTIFLVVDFQISKSKNLNVVIRLKTAIQDNERFK